MKKIILLLFILNCLLLSQNTKQKDHTRYFPLTIGSEWEYVFGDPETNSSSYRKVKEKKDNGIVLFEQNYLDNLQLNPWLTTFAIRNSKILRTGSAGGFFFESYKSYWECPIELVLPLKVGLKWEYKTDQGVEHFLKVIKWHDSVTTKYGTYKDVFEVEEYIPSIEVPWMYKYYAYGVGVILEEAKGYKSNSRIVGNVLKSYTIK